MPPTWMDLASKKLNLPLKYHTQGEASSPCPQCGGEDRFIIFEEGNCWCRQCNYKEWWLEDENRPTKEQIQEKVNQEKVNQASLLEKMHKCTLWINYHENERAQREWEQCKIDQFSFFKWGLGYCESCPLAQEYSSLTIPVFFQGKLFTIRHRLLGKEDDKYRTFMQGLTPAFFNLDSINLSNKIYIVEGEKKTIKLSSLGLSSIIGCPGLQFFTRLPDLLKRYIKPNQEVIFIPDPGEESIRKTIQVAKELPNVKCSLIELWSKPDDFIEDHGIKSFMNALRIPRPI